MTKVTILYGHPSDTDAFENYFLNTHVPIASKMKGVLKLELTKLQNNPDGSKPAYYRMAELYFNTPEDMQITLESVEGRETLADLKNFATGGVTSMIGSL